MATSRIAYGMSHNAYIPAYFMGISKNATPTRALLLNTAIGLLFFLPFPSWQHMVGFLVSCLVLGYVVGPMSLMVLAREQPTLFHPFSQKMIHSICIVAFIICNLLIYWSGWSIIYKMMILFLIGYVVLFFTAFKNKKSQEKLQMQRGSWSILYLSGMTVISYLGSFGGIHRIAFGADFFVIGIFSVAIYAIAYWMTLKTGNTLSK